MNPPPRPILLLAAIHSELRPALARLRLKRLGHEAHGLVRGVEVVAVVGGMGAAAAVAAADRALTTHRPRLVIHAGFAGGLDPALEAGEVVRFTEVRNAAHQAVKLVSGHPGRVLLTSPAPAIGIREKQAIFHVHGAAAIDMETYPLAARLDQAGVPMVAVRAISDPAHAPLPIEAPTWITPDGRTDRVATARWVVGRPWRLPELLRLAWSARRGAQRLAVAVERIVHEAAAADPLSDP